jgi:ribosome biogenesis protein Nip4
MTKEKKPITSEEIEFLKSVKDKVIFANWCESKIWITENEKPIFLNWAKFYTLLKDKCLEIKKVESHYVTSYLITEKGISEIN